MANLVDPNITIADVTEMTDAEVLAKLNSEMAATVLPVSIFVGVEAVLGFLGNVLVLYVFIFKYHECNFRYFVLCLAFIDFISTLTTVPGEIVTQMYWYIYPFPMICKVKSFFNVFTISAEAFCLFTIAVDRYRKVCTPFGKQITPHVARIVCITIYLMATILAFPTAIFWGTHTGKKFYMNRTINVTICEKDDKFVQSQMPLQFITAVEGIVAVFLVAMFTLYAFVSRRLILERSRTFSGSFGRSTMFKCSTIGEPQSENGSADDIGNIRPDLSSNEFASTSDTATKMPKGTNTNAENTSDTSSYPSQNNSTVPANSSRVTLDISVIGDIKSSTDDTNNLRVPSYQPHIGKSIRRKHASTRGNMNRIRTKTKIMLILTSVFVVTSIMYLTMLDFIARSGQVLEDMSNTEKAFYFLFFRLVFINHVINPIVYGCLDSQFKKVVRNSFDRIINFCRCN